ncbi:MAG: restriction endonuclease subunit S [Algicola sp.]|nr:restriction endonuclease subunit S [Algicola sp.]
MGNNWPLVKIADIQANTKGAIAIGPFGSRLKSDCYVNSGIPVIRGTNISRGPAFKGEFVYITEDKADTLGSSNVYKDDLVFPHRGSIGEVGIILEDKRFVLSSSLMKITCDTTKVNPKYIYYFFKSNEGIHALLKNASQVGTPGIGQPLTSLKSIEFRKPPLTVQNKIVAVTSSLDEKIELNYQMNQTLEQIAQALFKSWFIDFDPVIDNALAAGNTIPDELKARAELRKKVLVTANIKRLPIAIQQLFPCEFVGSTSLGQVPVNWAECNFLSLIKLIGGGTPKTTINEYWNGDIPWFSVVDAPRDANIFVVDTDKHITQLGVDKSSTKILREGTTIISARGTVGKCAMVATPMAMNQSCYGINGLEGTADEYIYFLTRYQVTNLQKRSHGSVFDTITKKTFESINLPFPGGPITQAFKNEVKPILTKVLANNNQINTLTKLRDTLLPKLISGELKIPEAAQQLEAALA